ncbi:MULTISPECIES: cytochrome ubiquinol oxidase subunit I [Kocuria]|uniref:cytochrome ubiquinol oxidase subunit I n=1 Tax=Kocuria TaxID=57493 RepID=UPI000660EF8D|nr:MULTISPECIES: cytochrome ubiquinol oxidase subunit I [Kocuria]MCT1366648.1 cytochrome ubiquinol oxidase subunit I [Rothia sp. p3-SID1597]RUQ22748.1 cytochrome ubiquinol oxidase subunit I [Kocuria sp. HSID16901]
MDTVEIARWQFGTTTVYHFMMVPLTLGLGMVVLIFNLLWVKTGKEEYLRMTKFWGKLFLINFIMGVATGLVQEFQFGMAWSEYSRFVGDVFGAPLAMEGLLAFFVESTFLGLWIFGWKKLKPTIHAFCLAAAVLASWLSATFIIIANSWMQHPVGYEVVNGRPILNDVWAVLTNSTALVAITHTIFGALAVAGSFLLGIAWYKLWKRRTSGVDSVDEKGYVIVGDAGRGAQDKRDYKVWFRSLRFGILIGLIGFLGTAFSGHIQGQLMFQQQPLKMAAAEAACHDGTAFSVMTVSDLGSQNCDDVKNLIELPGLLSFLAHDDFHTNIPGITTLMPEYQKMYGTNLADNSLYGDRAGQEISYLPLMEVTYWGFRIMITFGGMAAVACIFAWWITRKGTVPQSKWLTRLAIFGILAPFGANIAGWIFTEMGRQPFVVAPNPDLPLDQRVYMFTEAAVSPHVTAGEMLFSLAVLVLIYAVLMVVEVFLISRYVKTGVVAAMPELVSSDDHDDEDHPTKNDDVLAFAY